MQFEDRLENDVDSDTIEAVIEVAQSIERAEARSTSNKKKYWSFTSKYIWIILLLSYIGYVKFNQGNAKLVAPIERTDSMIRDRQIGIIDSLMTGRQDTNDTDNTVIEL